MTTTVSPASADPAIYRHQLGSRLRELRHSRALKLEEVAAALGTAPSTLSRIETGHAAARTSYVSVLLTLYGVNNPEEQARLTRLARHGQGKHWWTSHHDLIPPATAHYLALETTATRLRCYSPHLVPDLLATPDYATATTPVTRPDLTPGQARNLTALLPRRQQVLNYTGRRFHFILSEPALTSPVTTAAVAAAQARRLLDLATDPALTLQITQPSTAAMLTPPFSLLTFPDPTHPGTGCYHGPAGQITTTSRTTDIRTIAITWDTLTRTALTPDATSALLTELTTG